MNKENIKAINERALELAKFYGIEESKTGTHTLKKNDGVTIQLNNENFMDIFGDIFLEHNGMNTSKVDKVINVSELLKKVVIPSDMALAKRYITWGCHELSDVDIESDLKYEILDDLGEQLVDIIEMKDVVKKVEKLMKKKVDTKNVVKLFEENFVNDYE